MTEGRLRMSWLTNFVYLSSLVLWVGSTLFFTLCVAPVLFSQLPIDAAGAAVSVVFPFYYAVAAIAGLLLLALETARWRRTGDKLALAVVAIAWVCSLYAGGVVQPRAAALKAVRNAGGEGAIAAAAEFQQVHRVAMGLNTVVLLGGLVLLGTTARRLQDAGH